MKKIIAILPTLFLLSSCAETHLASFAWKQATYEEAGYSAPAITEKRKIGNPYTILGKTYYPIPSSEGYRRKGIASWYGKDFHAKKTANGETYNMYDMTAAHPTLPLPTYVRVTNLENGRAVIVRVNDRGPFLRGRVIDLSYAAATKLDMAEQGTAPVLLEALPTDGSVLNVKHPVPAQPKEIAEKAVTEPRNKWTNYYASRNREAAPLNVVESPKLQEQPVEDETNISPNKQVEVGGPVKIYIQTGAYGDISNALGERERLLKRYDNVVVQEMLKGNRALHRVRIGPIASVSEADALLEEVIANGWAQSRIAID